MSRIDALQQYRLALKAGQKYYSARIARHENPFPVVLEDMTTEIQTSGHASLGLIDIPVSQITGTLANGRKSAFAGNFMPLLPENSEFGQKWVSLCQSHLDDGGIRDPITCMEFMGQFYVMEGHKRVSVLSSFGARSITANVTRIIPTWSDDPAIVAYYEFMKFYRLAQIYQVQFNKPGQYAHLLEKLGFEKDHKWTQDERALFLSVYLKTEKLCTEQRLTERVRDTSVSSVLLGLLDIYPYEELTQADEATLIRMLKALLPDMAVMNDSEQHTVSTTPPQLQEKSLVTKILDSFGKPILNIAFVHGAPIETSEWSAAHDEGRRRLEEAFSTQISVRTYIAAKDTADQVMEQAIEDQAQVIFATAPTLLGPARRIAALHPSVKVLVCALSVPYTGVRTYYSRIYEAKFIAGAVAGAMSSHEPIGYIARYPILGEPAAINAFALGVRMTAPDARVLLKWSCLPGEPLSELVKSGVRIVSGHPSTVHSTDELSGTFMRQEDGSFRLLVGDSWNWGRMYQKIVRSILDGGWEMSEASPAVTYWWGVNSGVINVRLADSLPDGPRHLANILRTGLATGSIHPFVTTMADQSGRLRSDGDTWLTPSDIMRMNWLLENVSGVLPDAGDVLEMARETTRLLALKNDTDTTEERAVQP